MNFTFASEIETFNENSIDLEKSDEKKVLTETNKEKVLVINNYIDKLWLKRVWVSVYINVSLICIALFTGVVFVISIVFVGIMHVYDKYLDYHIRKLYQKKDYIKCF